MTCTLHNIVSTSLSLPISLSLLFIPNSHVYKYTRGPQKLDTVYTLGYDISLSQGETS